MNNEKSFQGCRFIFFTFLISENCEWPLQAWTFFSSFTRSYSWHVLGCDVLTVLPPTQIPPKPVVTELHLYLVLHSIKCYVFSGEKNYSLRKKSRGHSRDPVYLGNQFPWRACPPAAATATVHSTYRAEKSFPANLNGLKIIMFYLEHSL